MSEFDESKINAVRQYLQERFPDNQTNEYYEGDWIVQVFEILDRDHTGVCRAFVRRDFFDEVEVTTIPAFLSQHNLAPLMRKAGTTWVDVSCTGVHVDPASGERKAYQNLLLVPV